MNYGNSGTSSSFPPTSRRQTAKVKMIRWYKKKPQKLLCEIEKKQRCGGKFGKGCCSPWKKWSHSCTIPWKIAIIPGKNFLFLSNPWMNPSKYWPLSVLTINFVFFCTSVTYPPCSQKPLTPSPFCYLQPLIKNWVTTFSIAKKGGFFQL